MASKGNPAGSITLTAGSGYSSSGTSGAITITGGTNTPINASGSGAAAWFDSDNENVTLMLGDESITKEDVIQWKAKARQVDQLTEKVERLEKLIQALAQRIEAQDDEIGAMKAGALLDNL